MNVQDADIRAMRLLDEFNKFILNAYLS